MKAILTFDIIAHLKRKHPFTVFCLLAIGLTFVRPAFASHEQLTDDGIRQKVVGTWIVDRQSSNGLSIEGTVKILSDGSFVSKATLILGEKKQEDGYEGTWQVMSGYLIETITKTSSKIHRVGKITRDKIIHVDNSELSYLTESGDVVTRKRKK